MSIAGPQNLLLDRAGATATARGVGIVAAVGNDGPRAEPRFPAAYPWAIAVTAVDRDRGIYVRAGRGEHIDVAAPGVGLLVEDGRGRERLRTGTSFAAPFVTAALALTLARKADRPLEDALRDLTAASMDLGEPGPDAIYGVGLLQVEPLCR
jgi:subtilisin family serine protease